MPVKDIERLTVLRKSNLEQHNINNITTHYRTHAQSTVCSTAEQNQQELRAAQKSSDRTCKRLQRSVRLQKCGIQQLESKNKNLEESAALETARQSAVGSELKVRLEERDEQFTQLQL